MVLSQTHAAMWLVTHVLPGSEQSPACECKQFTYPCTGQFLVSMTRQERLPTLLHTASTPSALGSPTVTSELNKILLSTHHRNTFESGAISSAANMAGLPDLSPSEGIFQGANRGHSRTTSVPLAPRPSNSNGPTHLDQLQLPRFNALSYPLHLPGQPVGTEWKNVYELQMAVEKFYDREVLTGTANEGDIQSLVKLAAQQGYLQYIQISCPPLRWPKGLEEKGLSSSVDSLLSAAGVLGIRPNPDPVLHTNDRFMDHVRESWREIESTVNLLLAANDPKRREVLTGALDALLDAYNVACKFPDRSIPPFASTDAV